MSIETLDSDTAQEVLSSVTVSPSAISTPSVIGSEGEREWSPPVAGGAGNSVVLVRETGASVPGAAAGAHDPIVLMSETGVSISGAVAQAWDPVV